MRYFYYSAFFFETGAVIASGLGYNGRAEVSESTVVDPKNSDKLGSHKWDKIIGAYWWQAETSTNAGDFLKTWNYRVHVWSKHYNLERIVEQGKKPTMGQFLTVFAVSAFWHGWYPQYYVSFAFGAIVSISHRDIYQCWFFFKDIPRPVILFLCWVGCQFAINYSAL